MRTPDACWHLAQIARRHTVREKRSQGTHM